jgi:hypothetical protein
MDREVVADTLVQYLLPGATVEQPDHVQIA